jgi:hypothetical protein
MVEVVGMGVVVATQIWGWWMLVGVVAVVVMVVVGATQNWRWWLLVGVMAATPCCPKPVGYVQLFVEPWLKH